MNGGAKGGPDCVVEMDKSMANGNNMANYHFAITGKSFNIVKDHYPGKSLR